MIPKIIKLLIYVILTSFSCSNVIANDVILKKLQQKILNATNHVPGFEKSIFKIIKEGAQKLTGDKKRFQELVMTMDDDNLSILSHLVIEYDPDELRKTLNLIQDFFGDDYKPIAHLFHQKDDLGRSALYFAVLRKKNDMIRILTQKAEEIFGHDIERFLYFINGENEEGQREHLNYRTPLILAAYNDDEVALNLLINTASNILGQSTEHFKEFVHARDANGATAQFYAGEETKNKLSTFEISKGKLLN